MMIVPRNRVLWRFVICGGGRLGGDVFGLFFAFMGDLAQADVLELRPDQADGDDAEEGDQKQRRGAGRGGFGDAPKKPVRRRRRCRSA